jgi:hypothetical protein
LTQDPHCGVTTVAVQKEPLLYGRLILRFEAIYNVC